MSSEAKKTVSISLDQATARRLAELFGEGLEGVSRVADACNNIDKRALTAVADACNNIDARGLKALADACNNIDSASVKIFADACNNVNADQLKLVADACNNVDASRLAASLKPVEEHLSQIAGQFRYAEGAEQRSRPESR
jgi:hypothetical protein